MSTILSLYPLNDFAVKIILKTIDETTGAVVPLTEGTVTAFLATSNDPTATAPDPTLTTSGIHTKNGVWLALFDAAVLTPSLLDALFGSTPPYLIVQQPNGVRVYAQLTYTASRAAGVE
jgi:hypothetical protein